MKDNHSVNQSIIIELYQDVNHVLSKRDVHRGEESEGESGEQNN